MNTRIIWRRAHPVRLPSRDTAVHEELRTAWIRDVFRNARLTEWLAYELDRELQREGE